MNILSVKDLSCIGREKTLFSAASFGLEEGEKVSLIGRNGCGKSTMLRIIAGLQDADSGSVVMAKNAGFSFLAQTPAYNPGDTISQHLFKSESPRVQTIRDYEDTCSAVASGNAGAEKRLESLTLKMDELDLWNYENRITSILTTLGITDFERKMKELSGGMIKKVALAQVLIDDTALLLLDEPTNHLDIETISWLEDYLRETPRAVLMVTHDRYFLDSVCSSIYEIDNGELKQYKGNFSYYLDKKAEAEEMAAAYDAKVETILRREREWLLRGPCARGTKSKARIQSAHEMINREKRADETTFEFEVTGRRLGGKILDVDHISKAWSNHPVITDFSYLFKKGDRIGVIGNNGAGKTTFLNILTGTLAPDSGTVTAGENTVFAYYRQNPELSALGGADMQNRTDTTATEKTSTVLTVLDYIKEEAEYVIGNDGKQLTAARLLEKFGFEGKIQYSPVTSLSGGERKRVYLVRLLMRNPNFIILDEPTNDFDIYTMSVLESFLASYGGCLVVVSHDRYFMDRTADTLLILEAGGIIRGFTGSCSEYLAYKKEVTTAAQKDAAEKKAEQHEKDRAKEKTLRKNEKTKLTFKEQQEFTQLEAEIETAETRKTELETLMASGESDHVKITAWAAEHREITAKLEKGYARWEELAQYL